MKLTITKTIFLGLGLCACDSLSKEQVLQVEMLGVNENAAAVTGEETPNFQIYNLREVALINADGASLTQLYDPTDEDLESTFRVIERAQVVYSNLISELTGQEYSGVRVSFDPSVVGGKQERNELTFNLSQSTQILSKAFTVDQAKSIFVTVKVKWANTINGEQMSEPSFDLSIK